MNADEMRWPLRGLLNQCSLNAMVYKRTTAVMSPLTSGEYTNCVKWDKGELTTQTLCLRQCH